MIEVNPMQNYKQLDKKIRYFLERFLAEARGRPRTGEYSEYSEGPAPRGINFKKVRRSKRSRMRNAVRYAALFEPNAKKHSHEVDENPFELRDNKYYQCLENKIEINSVYDGITCRLCKSHMSLIYKGQPADEIEARISEYHG